MLYTTIRDLAFTNGSPLYRQDDNAASRLFSADTLSYLTNHYPDHVGEIVYLFAFGDLIDSYQNRSLPHRERVKMLLRARYFLDFWERFLKHAGYKKRLHFLSREAVDILRQIIEGLLGLIYIYRDHLHNPNGINPLLPWLHSTEKCEHIFGEAFKTAQLYTRQFALLPPKHFILCLCSAVNMNETQVVEIAQNDFLEFEKMSEGVKQIKEALHKYRED